jgi:hypothetical protein
MTKWWKVGFASVLTLTVSAQLVHWALVDPAWGGQHAAHPESADYSEPGSLTWNWSDEEDCQQFEACVYIEVQGTHRCEEQLFIDAAITDGNDHFVANTSMVINSPRQSGFSLIEVGVNRDDFEYWLVGDVRCTSGVPTAEALI